MSVNTNHVYNAFNEQIDRSRRWLSTRLRGACGYDLAVLVDRLTQRTVEIALPAYAVAAAKRLEKGIHFVPPPEAHIDCGMALLHAGSGRVRVSRKQRLAGQREFITLWVYCLYRIILGMFQRGRGDAATLVLDLTSEDLFRDGTDEEFVQYCRSGPIEPLRSGRRFLIRAAGRPLSSSPGTHQYCAHPLMTLLQEARLGVAGRARLLLRHLTLLFRYQLAVARTGELSLIAREFAYREIVVALDERRYIDAIVMTCSSWGCQPLWVRSLRNTRVHMIWYSQAWKTSAYDPDGVKSTVPAVRWIRADVHWVWTRAFSRYLMELGLGDSDIHAVGPILWYHEKTALPDPDTVRVLAFDVPAVTDQVMLQVVGEITNYFRFENLRAFVTDVIDLKVPLEKALRRPVSVWMKMKRGMRPHYAVEYFQFVEQVAAEGLLMKASSDENLFSLISGSDLVIAYPFTSPAYIAEWLGIPSIYYDPTETVLRDEFFDSEELVRFARGPAELHAAALELLHERAASSARLGGVPISPPSEMQ